MSDTKNIKDLTLRQCEEISAFFFDEEKTGRAIYAQLRGERTLSKEVEVAAEMYISFEVSSETTRETLLKEHARRFKMLSTPDFDRLESSREGFAFVSQENPSVEAAEGIDLTPEHKAINNISARMGVEL